MARRGGVRHLPGPAGPAWAGPAVAPRRVHVFRVGGGVLDWRSSQGDPSRPIDVSSDPRRRSASAIGVCQSESFGPSQSIRVRRSVSGDPSQEIRVCRPESSPADPTQVSRFLACLGGFTRLWLLSQPSNPGGRTPPGRLAEPAVESVAGTPFQPRPACWSRLRPQPTPRTLSRRCDAPSGRAGYRPP